MIISNKLMVPKNICVFKDQYESFELAGALKDQYKNFELTTDGVPLKIHASSKTFELTIEGHYRFLNNSFISKIMCYMIVGHLQCENLIESNFSLTQMLILHIY